MGYPAASEARPSSPRLRRRGEFAAVHQRGHRRGGRLLVAWALANELPYNRYGFAVSRQVGGAVVRNRVRRRLRELVRQQVGGAGWDVVVAARPPAALASWQELRGELLGLFRRLGTAKGSGAGG